MPWRLIGFICVFIVFLIFIGFNLGEDYQSNINFGFKVIENVPVFYTIFVSFLLGFLCTLPVVLATRKKGKSFEKDGKPKLDEPVAVVEGFNEPAPSYSGGKYFKKKNK